MILAQKFKTLEGAHKRAMLENACLESWEKARISYRTVRFYKFKIDEGQFDPKVSEAGGYHWRVEKIKHY